VWLPSHLVSSKPNARRQRSCGEENRREQEDLDAERVHGPVLLRRESRPEPVAGQSVILFVWAGTKGKSRARTTTDANGRFSFAVEPERTAIYIAESPETSGLPVGASSGVRGAADSPRAHDGSSRSSNCWCCTERPVRPDCLSLLLRWDERDAA